MQVFTLEHLIKIERVASRAVNASKAFAEGQDRQLLEDLTTLISEVRHAASCTQQGEISIADLWVSAEARTNDLVAKQEHERKLGEATQAAYETWNNGYTGNEAATRWAEAYQVDRVALLDRLNTMIRSSHLDRQLVRTDN
jgi:hypothetical protein